MAQTFTYMTPSDAAWLHMDRPTNLMMITAIMWFDAQLPFERYVDIVRERFVEPYPRMRRRVVEPAIGVGPPRWEDDPSFDLSMHVLRTALPAPGGRAELQAMVSDLMSTPLDRDRPLWQFHVVEGFVGGGAVIVRIHHCVADGISLARVLLAMADDAGDVSSFIAPKAPPRPGAFYRPALKAMKATVKAGSNLWHEGVELLSSPLKIQALGKLGTDVAASAARLLTLSPDPPTALRGELGVRKVVAWSDPIPLPEVKQSCKRLGCTINDILLTAISGALRRYLTERGGLVADVRAFVPVNLRPLDKPVPRELGNKFSLAVLPLPVAKPTPVLRMAALKREMDAIKASQQPAVAYGVLNAMGMTPKSVETSVLKFFGQKASAVMTNVPGPRTAVYIAGAKIEGFQFWVPMSAGVGLGVSIFSYNGQVNVGVASDAGLVSDPEALVAAYHDELKALQGIDPTALHSITD